MRTVFLTTFSLFFFLKKFYQIGYFINCVSIKVVPHRMYYTIFFYYAGTVPAGTFGNWMGDHLRVGRGCCTLYSRVCQFFRIFNYSVWQLQNSQKTKMTIFHFSKFYCFAKIPNPFSTPLHSKKTTFSQMFENCFKLN